MGNPRGGRPSAEFVDGFPRRRAPSRRGRPEVGEPDRTSHIDLRVVSMVEMDLNPMNPEIDDWNDFLNDLGRRNHAKGMARPLGGIAITYIPSKHLNAMLRDARPKEYFDEQRKKKLFRKVSAGLDEYIREAARTASEQRFQQVIGAHEVEQARQRELVAAGAGDWATFDVLDVAAIEETEHDPGLSAEERLRMVEHPFGAVTMNIQGLDVYGGGRKYGLDLSANEAIYEVRSGLIGYLAGEGYDVSTLRRNWEAHATVFDIHDHMKGVPLSYQAELPGELKFDPPSTEMIVVPRQTS